jgi:F0F1-type ATP synthase epsilon subunit
MSHLFNLTIATVGSTFYQGQASSVTCPGEGGVITILADHEPYVTNLKQGVIHVTNNEGKQTFSIEQGVVECAHNLVTILL